MAFDENSKRVTDFFVDFPATLHDICLRREGCLDALQLFRMSRLYFLDYASQVRKVFFGCEVFGLLSYIGRHEGSPKKHGNRNTGARDGEQDLGD